MKIIHERHDNFSDRAHWDHHPCGLFLPDASPQVEGAQGHEELSSPEEIKQKIPVAFFAQKGLDQLNFLLINRAYQSIPDQLDIIWTDLGPKLQAEVGRQPSKEIESRISDLLNYSFKKFGISERDMRAQYGRYSQRAKGRAMEYRRAMIIRDYALTWKNNLMKVLSDHEMLWQGKEVKETEPFSRPHI